MARANDAALSMAATAACVVRAGDVKPLAAAGAGAVAAADLPEGPGEAMVGEDGASGAAEAASALGGGAVLALLTLAALLALLLPLPLAWLPTGFGRDRRVSMLPPKAVYVCRSMGSPLCPCP